MASFDHEANLTELRKTFLAISGLPTPTASKIAFDNVPFTPPPVDPPAEWIRETYLPDREIQVATGLIEATGMIEYDVFWPIGQGTNEAWALAKKISDAFTPGTQIASGGREIAIDRKITLPGREEQQGNPQLADSVTWYVIPVQVFWRSYETNNP